MAEQDDKDWWNGILLPTLERLGRPVTVSEIKIAFSAGRFMVRTHELDAALTTLRERGVLKAVTSKDGNEQWLLANATPQSVSSVAKSVTDSNEAQLFTRNGDDRQLKDEVARSLLDLIEKAHGRRNARLVAILERAISQIYGGEAM